MGDDVTTLQDYLTSPSKAQNVYADIQATIGNPVYSYLNGLVSGQELYDQIQNLLYEPIDIAGADWQTLANDAEKSGDELLIEGYSLIQAGLTPDRVRAKLSEKYADSYGALTDDERNQIDFMKSSLETFAEAWNNAADIQAKKSIGVYKEDEFGRILAPVDWQTGFSRLRSFGLDETTANPDLWRQSFDPGLMRQSQDYAAEAGMFNQDFEKLAKETTKTSASTAKKVYEDFLKKSPAGKEILAKGGALPKDQKVTQSNIAELIRKGVVEYVRKPEPKTVDKKGFQELYNSKEYKDYIRNVESGVYKKVPDLNAYYRFLTPTSTASGQQSDYWAKLAASYAGRASQETNAKQLATLKKQRDEAQAVSDQAKAASYVMPNTRGLELLQNSIALAATQPRAAARPGPRVLSDEEINTMASMIAGSMQQ